MTYEWSFGDLICYKSFGGQVDVVSTIPWILTATDGDFSASDFSTLGVRYEEGDPIIPYHELVKSDLESWCEAGLDVDSIKERLDARIAEEQNPTKAVMAPPWS